MKSNAPDAAGTSDGPETGTLHDRILNEIHGHIVSGRWPPGSRIPFETDLAKQFGCARMTVNKALIQLTRSGLLVRHRKSGTFVKAPQSFSAALEITNVRTEVEDYGKEYDYRLLKDVTREIADDDMQKFRISLAGRVRDLTCLHYADGIPFCFEQRLINVQAVPAADEANFTDEPAGSWLLRTVPWSAAEHEISACSALQPVADALNIEPGSPCLVIERRTINNGEHVTWAHLSYTGDKHSLFARFVPHR